MRPAVAEPQYGRSQVAPAAAAEVLVRLASDRCTRSGGIGPAQRHPTVMCADSARRRCVVLSGEARGYAYAAARAWRS